MGHLRPIVPKFYMFSPRGKRLAYGLTNFPNLLIIFPNFLHNTLYATWITPSFNCRHPLMCVHTSHQPYGYPPSYVVLMATNALETMMQFMTPLLSLHKMMVSTWDKNNYMRFLQPHSTPLVNESTLCLPKMAFTP